MTSEYRVLVDSDAFVGRFYAQDGHYATARSLFQRLEAERQSLVTTSFVVGETATVLSHRQGQALALQFLDVFVRQGGIDIIHITEALQAQATEIFLSQTQRGTSMTDCANVAVMHQFQIPHILSFDKVYANTFNLQVIRESMG